jgi:hypothetical protein
MVPFQIERAIASRGTRGRRVHHPDGSFELVSPPALFGNAGFYFVVRDGSAAWIKPVPAITEEIRVYVAERDLRTDHTLRIWGRPFLRLHYAMRRA